MPRNKWNKGDKTDDFVVQSNQKNNMMELSQEQQNSDQLKFQTYVERLQKENSYFIKKASKLTCSLCSFNFPTSSFSAFKTEVSTHMKSKCHKKKVDAYNSENDSIEKSEIDAKTSEQNGEKNIKQSDTEEDNNEKREVNDKIREMPAEENVDRTDDRLSDLLREVEYKLNGEIELTNKKNLKFNRKNCLTDFETTFSLLEKNNPVTQASKKFLVKAKDNINYYCKICQELIFDSTIAGEFKNNLWAHINDERHREILPNFSKVERDFNKVKSELSKKLPVDLRSDLKYFEVGPVFRFLKCLLCNEAVSENLHRLQNHIVGKSHMKNKEKEFNKKEEVLSVQSINNNTTIWFQRLMTDMENQFKEDQFKEDLKNIHIGKMPGYVVCSLCSYVMLPTFYYMKVHFVSDVI